MSRRFSNNSPLGVRFAPRRWRHQYGAKSEPLVRRLMLAWLLPLGGVLLTQALPFPGSARLGYWFMVVVALGIPVVILLLLWVVGLGLANTCYRLRVLRRAAKWQRPAPPTDWFEEGWTGPPR